MDGKEENLYTDGNSFLGLHSHPDCDGKPPDKAVTSLMAKKTTHTNQENSALLSFNVDIKFWTYCIVTLEAQNPLLLISIIIVIETSFITWLKSQRHILILKYKNCSKPPWSSEIILKNITLRNYGSAFSVSKLKMAHGEKHWKVLSTGEKISRLPDPLNFTSRRDSK